MKLQAHTLLVLAVLAGCSTSLRQLSEADVSSGIKVQAGYADCPSCSKVKTYSSPPVVRVAVRSSAPQATGWINAKVSLVLTNLTEGFVPRYQLVAEFVNNGDFQRLTDLYIAGVQLPAAGERQQAQCFSNIGSGCSWTQAYALDARLVEDAVQSGSGIELFIGKSVQSVSQINDGYTQHAVRKSTLVGASETIASGAIVGFVKGLQARGAELPTSAKEGDERLAKQLDAADRLNEVQGRLIRERPLKQKNGVRVCRPVGSFTNIGFVEGAANGKVQIRIVDTVVPGTQLRAGGFREQVIWDDPDSWSLCGSN